MGTIFNVEIEKVKNGYILSNGDRMVFDSFKLMLECLNDMVAIAFLGKADVKVHVSIEENIKTVEEKKDETKESV